MSTRRHLVLPPAFSDFPAALPPPPSSADRARQIIDVYICNPTFLAALVQRPQVAAYLARTLKAKAQRDSSFAELVANMPFGFWRSQKASSVNSEPRPHLNGDRACSPGKSPLTTQGTPVSFIREPIATPARLSGSIRKRGVSALEHSGPVTGRSGRTQTRGSRSLLGSPDIASTGVRPRQAMPCPVVATDPRSLINAFDDHSESDDDDYSFGGTGATPAKSRKLGPAYGAVPWATAAEAAKADADEVQRGALLAPLPAAVVAQVASFLGFQDTARLQLVVSGAIVVLNQPSAWDPLVLDFEECGRVLRRLRDRDAGETMDPAEYPLPAARALTQVTELRVELMEPDRVRMRDDDELPDGIEVGPAATPRSSPPRRSSAQLILDPLEELARRLRLGWLPSAIRVEISNIEDARLDYVFPKIRGQVFGSFPWMRLSHDAGRYTLCAARAAAAPGPLRRTADLTGRALVTNAARQPKQADKLLAPAEEVNDVEALFFGGAPCCLQEWGRLPLCARPMANRQRCPGAPVLWGNVGLPCNRSGALSSASATHRSFLILPPW